MGTEGFGQLGWDRDVLFNLGLHWISVGVEEGAVLHTGTKLERAKREGAIYSTVYEWRISKGREKVLP